MQYSGFKGIHKDTGGYRGIQGDTGGYRGILGYIWDTWDTRDIGRYRGR